MYGKRKKKEKEKGKREKGKGKREKGKGKAPLFWGFQTAKLGAIVS